LLDLNRVCAGPAPCGPGGALNLLREPPDQCADRQFTDPEGITKESVMIRKSNLLAIVATAALGLAMLSATEASARGHGGGGGMGGHGGGGMRVVHGGHGGHGGGGRIGHIGRHHHHHPHWHVRYHRPIWYTGVGAVGYTVGTTRVAGPCTCLSKEYTPDGRVLFKDLCTNEAAINPPVIAPQQSSSLDVPVQQAANVQPTYQAAPANALPQVDPLTGLPK
jgi:hypothetical protein